MDIHYNAFISYRHHPEDIKVAEQIHRGLEHYRVPKALKKTRDTKMRLFRDKEELPITSNLSDDITRALENSDFLIVICSTHTKESLWVQREIEMFLQTHDHSRVLTVLVDGEPYDTIPEILCSKEGIDPVTGEKRTIPIEPLSCDWRISRRRARREELPRLAAALLGCGYDELRQREKQYRTRRLAAVLSVAMAATLAFTSYVIYNSIQIRKANEQLEKANIEIRSNLEQAQINQSQYLAGASQQNLEAGDRMMAMALAMAALPESEGQRPYVSQAEKALGEAVGIYMSEEELAAVGCLSCDALIAFFEDSDNGDIMFVCDERNVLSVWDIQTCQRIVSVRLEGNVSDMRVTAKDEVILLVNKQLCCYDRDLNLLWQTDEIESITLSKERDVILAVYQTDTVRFLDTSTGKEVYAPVNLPESLGDQMLLMIRFQQDTYDLEQPLVLEYSGYENESLVLVNPKNGTTVHLADLPAEFSVCQTGTTEDGNILVAGMGNEELFAGYFLNMFTCNKCPWRIWCYSPEGEELWVTELTTYVDSLENTFYQIPETGKIFCQVGNLLTVLEAQSGEILNSCETSAIPVWIKPREDMALVLMGDGAMGFFYYDEDGFSSMPYFKDNIGMADSGLSGYYVSQRFGDEILIYNFIVDTNWTPFDGEYEAVLDTYARAGNYVAMDCFSEILMFDMQDQSLIWSLTEESDWSLKIIGFTGDGEKLWLLNDGQEFFCVDSESGAYEVYELPREMENMRLYYSPYGRAVVEGNVIYLYAEGYQYHVDGIQEAGYIVTFDTETLQTDLVKAYTFEKNSFEYQHEIRTVHEGRVYLWREAQKTLYEICTRTQTVNVMFQDTASCPVVQYLADGNTVMIAVGNKVTFTDNAGQVIFTTDLNDATGIAAYRTEEAILLLADTGKIIRFDHSGKNTGELAVHQYINMRNLINSALAEEKITWLETGDGDLFINLFNSGSLINLDQWALLAWVPNCVTYLPELDLFVTWGRDPDASQNLFGVFPRYTLEQIKEMAREALGSFELTQEQKEQYGIS